jgi:hypothetical protein
MYNLLSTHNTDLICYTLKNIYPSRDNVPVMKTLLQDSEFWSITINGIFWWVLILGHGTFIRDWVSGLQTYSQIKCRVYIVHLAQNIEWVGGCTKHVEVGVLYIVLFTSNTKTREISPFTIGQEYA